MALYSKITDDMKTAMKAGDQPRVDALRFGLAGLNSFQKEKQAKEPGSTITDDEVVSVLQKDVKRRKESIELFKQGNREDLVTKEEADLAVIAAYIPKELTHEEVEKMVDDAIAALVAAGGAKDFNSVMRETMKVAKGRADGKTVGDIIKAKLGA
jgi:uncharacterized protein YqeY